MTSRLTSFDINQKCDDFLLPGPEIFSAIYNMKEFTATIFSRYFTFRASDFKCKATAKTLDKSILNILLNQILIQAW